MDNPDPSGNAAPLELPPHRRPLAVPLPAAPVAIAAVLPADILALIDPALTLQDLTRERTLQPAPRVQVGDKVVPAVGGIPLFAKLGQGRMGVVYYGVSPDTKSSVAVKIVPVAVANKDLVQRFHREVRIASTIRSPHLVTIRDLGEEHSIYYVITDFVPGTSAGLYLQEARKAGSVGLPEALALDLCIAVVTGLVEAHKNGIFHGDLRPENILIPLDKQTGQLSFNDALLADLGLPRVEELGGVLKDSSAAMGTPGFMSPEQAVDPQVAGKPADVFGLGATLYCLLTGQTPFADPNPMTVIMHTIQQPHEPVTKRRADVTPATSELLDRCLAKQPNERYVDASALLEALAVCRAALAEPQDSQQSAVKRVTLVLKKKEVGTRVIGSGDATPAPLPFLNELRASGQQPPPAPAASPAPLREPAAAAKLPETAAQSPQAAASPDDPRPASAVSRLMGAVTGLFAKRTTPEDVESHGVLLKSARELLRTDPASAAALLEQARKLKIADPKWQEREQAVEDLIAACQIIKQRGDMNAAAGKLAAAEKVYPGDPAIAWLRSEMAARE